MQDLRFLGKKNFIFAIPSAEANYKQISYFSGNEKPIFPVCCPNIKII